MAGKPNSKTGSVAQQLRNGPGADRARFTVGWMVILLSVSCFPVDPRKFVVSIMFKAFPLQPYLYASTVVRWRASVERTWAGDVLMKQKTRLRSNCTVSMFLIAQL